MDQGFNQPANSFNPPAQAFNAPAQTFNLPAASSYSNPPANFASSGSYAEPAAVPTFQPPPMEAPTPVSIGNPLLKRSRAVDPSISSPGQGGNYGNNFNNYNQVNSFVVKSGNTKEP